MFCFHWSGDAKPLFWVIFLVSNIKYYSYAFFFQTSVNKSLATHASLHFKLRWHGRADWDHFSVCQCGCRGRSQKQGRSVLWYSAVLQSSSGPQPWERAGGGSYMGKLNPACIVDGGLNGQRVPGGIEKQKSQEQSRHGSRKRKSWLKQRGQQTRAHKAPIRRLPISLTPFIKVLISLYNPDSFWNVNSEVLWILFCHLHCPNIPHWENERTCSTMLFQLEPTLAAFSRKSRNPKGPVYPE